MALSEIKHLAFVDWNNFCRIEPDRVCEPLSGLFSSQWVFAAGLVLSLIVILPHEAEVLGTVTERRERRFLRKKGK